MVDYKKEKKRKNTCRWPCELLLGGDFTTLVWKITWSFFNCPPPLSQVLCLDYWRILSMLQTTNLGPSIKDGWLELCDGLSQNWKAGHHTTLTGKAKSRLTGPSGNLLN